MHDVAWHHEVNCVRSKDAQKQLKGPVKKGRKWRFEVKIEIAPI